jgi:hypothetical protein
MKSRVLASLVAASSLLASAPADAQALACPATDLDAIAIIERTDEFTDANAIRWAKCPSTAARIFAASVLGDSDPAPENLSGIIELLDDADDEVSAQAFAAVLRQSAAIEPALRERIDDARPAQHPLLARGDTALAALRALKADGIPSLPLKVRKWLTPAEYEELRLSEAYGALSDYSATAADAASLVEAARTSPRPDLVLKAVRGSTYARLPERVAAYQEAEAIAWNRLVREGAARAIQIGFLSSMVWSAWDDTGPPDTEDRDRLETFPPARLLELAASPSNEAQINAMAAVEKFSLRKDFGAVLGTILCRDDIFDTDVRQRAGLLLKTLLSRAVVDATNIELREIVLRALADKQRVIRNTAGNIISVMIFITFLILSLPFAVTHLAPGIRGKYPLDTAIAPYPELADTL